MTRMALETAYHTEPNTRPALLCAGLHDDKWFSLSRIVVMYQFQQKMSQVDLIQQDLRDGVVEVTSYEVTDAIVIEEGADENNQYFLHLADGRVLFLSDQYLYDLEADGLFPNTHFEIVRTPRAQQWLHVRCLGTPFAPSSRRPDFRKAEYDNDNVPQDHDILEVDFDSLR